VEDRLRKSVALSGEEEGEEEQIFLLYLQIGDGGPEKEERRKEPVCGPDC